MKKNMIFKKILPLMLLVMIFSSCQKQVEEKTEPIAEEMEQEEMEQEEMEQNNSDNKEKISLYQIVTEDGEEHINNIIYMDSKSFWQDASAQDMVLSTNEVFVVNELEEIFNNVFMNVESHEELSELPELPEGTPYIYYEIAKGMGNETIYQIAILPRGEVYIHVMAENGTNYRYALWDEEDYNILKKNTEDIVKKYKSNLEYTQSMFIYPTEFLPNSTAVRIHFSNQGNQSVFLNPESISIQRKQEDIWESLKLEQESIEAIEIKVEENFTYDILLKDIENGNEEGHYRVSLVLSQEDDSISLEDEYTITSDAFETSYPLSPTMTAENQVYYDNYLSAWGFYSPFQNDFSREEPLKDYQPYLLYQSSVFQEGRGDEYSEKYQGEIPAKVVEDTLHRHFVISVDEYRQKLAEGHPGERYNDDKDSYYFEGGYGGGSSHGVITNVEKNENTLKITCDWYGMDDSFTYSHEVTIELGDSSDEFLYVENKVKKEN